MLGRKDLRRRHEKRLPPGVNRRRSAWAATMVLPVPTSPSSMWLATRGADRAERMSSRACFLLCGQLERNADAQRRQMGTSITWRTGVASAWERASSIMR